MQFTKCILSSAVVAALADSYKCPGSPALIHAWSEQTTEISVSCSAWVDELRSRVNGQPNDWHDPHNYGLYNSTYTINDDKAGELHVQRWTDENGCKERPLLVPSCITDQMIFTYEDGENGCVVKGCSESQANGVLDFSDNFCNLRMLTCGKEDGCVPVQTDYTTSMTENKQSTGSKNNMADCLKVSALQAPVSAQADSYKCPGSPALIHAWSEQTTEISVSCSAWVDELRSRVNGQPNDWHDPHNNGLYTINDDKAGELQVQRLTGDKKYTDQMIFTYEDGENGCVVKGCSESQVTSVLDFSGNFCNLRMLTCGKDDGCVPAKTDYTTSMTQNKQSTGSKNNMADCLKVFASTMV